MKMKAELLFLAIFATSGESQFPFSNSFQEAQNPVQNVAQEGLNFGVSAAKGIASSVESLLQEEWANFRMAFNKNYSSPEEEKFRLENFIENRHKVATFNQEFGRGLRTFAQQANNLADMLFHEFNRLYNGFNNGLRPKIQVSPASAFVSSANVIYPDHVDWREVGAVSTVRSQEACACCWAFAAAGAIEGAIEGHNFRKTGRLTELSPQHLMDCSDPQGNEGCSGGLMEPAYEYVKLEPGINTLDSYPYEARDGQCRFRPEDIGAHVTGYVAIPSGDEKALEAAVATLGPVSVAIHVLPTFQFYKEGIYYDPECSSKAEVLNHAVLVVGYGTEPSGEKYWLVKNSYGPDWGIGGYIKMAKDKNNHCGIATQATYPLV